MLSSVTLDSGNKDCQEFSIVRIVVSASTVKRISPPKKISKKSQKNPKQFSKSSQKDPKKFQESFKKIPKKVPQKFQKVPKIPKKLKKTKKNSQEFFFKKVSKRF